MAPPSHRARPPAVSGTFYPSDLGRLRTGLDAYLAATPSAPGSAPPKALIAPHAGYIYSGPVAGSAFARLERSRETITRVVLVGPSHFVDFKGIATVTVDAFETPLGDIPIDRDALDTACQKFPWVHQLDQAHAKEHCLEVELPFLQKTLGSFSIAPFVTGNSNPGQVSDLIDLLWGGPETLLVVSSDLSHYHSYGRAKKLDRATADAIESLAPEKISVDQACGCLAVQGLLLSARRHGLEGHLLDLRNSGDTAGPKDRVVGYGAFSFA